VSHRECTTGENEEREILGVRTEGDEVQKLNLEQTVQIHF
jgi:hypothetical protein